MRKLLFCLLLSVNLFAETDVQKLSEALGHLLGKQLEQLDMPIDLTALAKGMEDRAAGAPSPWEEETCLQYIAEIQDHKKLLLEKENLIAAETFLDQNKNKDSVIELIEGKLQIEIAKEGTGEILTTEHSPVIRLWGHYLDGKSFLDNKNGVLISLGESMSSFQLGLAGMMEGERRILYVHPTLGFTNLDPNALQIFEVELIRADAGGDEYIALESFDLPSVQ